MATLSITPLVFMPKGVVVTSNLGSCDETFVSFHC